MPESVVLPPVARRDKRHVRFDKKAKRDDGPSVPDAEAAVAQIARQSMALFLTVRNACSTQSNVSMALFQDSVLLWSAQANGRGTRNVISLPSGETAPPPDGVDPQAHPQGKPDAHEDSQSFHPTPPPPRDAPGTPPFDLDSVSVCDSVDSPEGGPGGDGANRNALPPASGFSMKVSTGISSKNVPAKARGASFRNPTQRNGVAFVERAVQTLNEDLHNEARIRASRSYRKISKFYKAELGALQGTVEELTQANEDLAQGGGKYAALAKENASMTRAAEEYRAKISDLAELVARCSDRIARLESDLDDKRAKLGAPQKMQWECLQTVFPDFLLPAQRTDDNILKELIERVEVLFETQKEAGSRILELQSKIEAADKAAARQADSIESMNQQAQEQEEEIRSLQDEIAKQHDELHQKRQITTLTKEETQQLENQKAFLSDLLLLSHKRAARCFYGVQKPFFSGLGKGKAVPAFLRYHGQIPNLNIDLPTLERVIHLIWLHREIDLFARLDQHSKQSITNIDSPLGTPMGSPAGAPRRASGFDTAAPPSDAGDPPSSAGGGQPPGSGGASPQPQPGRHLGAYVIPNSCGLVPHDQQKDTGFDRRRNRIAETRLRWAVVGLSSLEDRWVEFGRMDYANTVGETRGELAKLRPFNEHIHVFLTENFSNAYEAAYSLHNAAERHCLTPDVELFQAIASGDFSDEIYFDQQAMLDKLKLLLLEEDASYNQDGSEEISWTASLRMESGRPKLLLFRQPDDFPQIPSWKSTGKLPGHRMIDALESFFQNREPSDVTALHLALSEALRPHQAQGVGLAGVSPHIKNPAGEAVVERLRELESAVVPYKALFAPDAKYPERLFLDELKRQHLRDARKTALQIRKAFASAAGIGCGKTQIILKVVVRNILAFDRNTPDEVIRYLDVVVRDSMARQPLFTCSADLPPEPYELEPLLQKAKATMYRKYLNPAAVCEEDAR